MKHLRKFLLLSVISFFAACLFCLPKTNKQSSAAVLNADVFNYISISINGQTLSSENLQTFDNETYIITNGSVSVNFNYSDYFFNNFEMKNKDNSPADDSFFISYVSYEITRNSTAEEFSNFFEIDDISYYYLINEANIKIYKNYSITPPITVIPTINTEFGNNKWINVTESADELVRTITFVKSYTLKANSDNCSLSFRANSIGGTFENFTLNFEHPVLDFQTNDIVEFTCEGIDIGGETVFTDTKLASEHSYSNLKLKILNNDYTEYNPLYFDINHNGFLYTFKLYSKNISSSDYLFVEYYDEEKPANNKSLATVLDGDNVTTAINKYLESTTFNKYSINFNKTGRYEISVYDSTYKLGLNNSNYYNTSFYIKNNESTAFENVYVIFQTLDDNDQPIEYIVSESTKNKNVKVLIKNLSYYFERENEILEDDDVILDLTKTTFAGSSNIPVTTSYTKKQLEDLLNEDGDFVLKCSDDAIYQFYLYQYHNVEYIEDLQTVTKKEVLSNQYYQFIIVKNPKTSYTRYDTDENGDVLKDIDGNPKTITKEADEPYKTLDQIYTRNIKAMLTIQIKFDSTLSAEYQSEDLNKTYVNEYVIKYAMQSVKIERFEMPDPDSSDKMLEQLNFRVFGVGDITVNVTFNGETTTYILNSEENNNSLTFKEHGVYSVSFVDSMGTSGSQVFDFTKPMSTSALILIILAVVIVAGIVLFIILSRSKIKTR